MMVAASTPARRSKSVRTCVACRKVVDPAELVRVVVGPEGEVFVELGRGAVGRGAWLHPVASCLERAARGGLSRSFHREIAVSAEELAEQLRRGAHQRVASLLGAARRSGHLAVGTMQVRHALERRSAELVVVATDARAAADTPWVQGEVAAGRAMAWGSKQALGRALGRDEVGVVAATEAGLAGALQRMIRLAHLAAPTVGSRKVAVDTSTEVR